MEVFIDALAKYLNVSISKNQVPVFMFSFMIPFMKKWKIKLHALSNRTEYSSEKLKTRFKYPYGIENGISHAIEYYLKSGKLK